MNPWKKFTALFRKKQLDAEMAEEMCAHLERRTETNLAAGMPADEARYAAQRAFGGVEQIKELAREQRGWMWIDQLGQDLRHAIGSLRRNPGFAATAILTLTLGIGSCTAMFSLVSTVLLRPLPFREPGRLVLIENNGGSDLSSRTSRADTVVAWREQSRSLEAIAAYDAFSNQGRTVLSGAGEPIQLRRVGISDNFLTTLGVPLLHGRNFTAEECANNGPLAVILTYGLWQRQFGGDPAVVSRTVTLNNNPVSVVGVLPRTFDFDAIFSPGTEIDVLTPYKLTPETARRGNNALGIARLRPGATIEQARSELALVSERLRAANPARGALGANVTPLDAALRGKFRGAFLLLGGAVLCVLAIACVNLSNLLLARMNVRRQEFAVRIALGARRRHLVLQTLVESLLLAFAGAVFAVPLAMLATRGLARLQTFGVPLLQDAAVDPVTLGVTILLTTLAGIACGVLPALHVSGQHGLLQNASHQRTAGRTSGLARNSLVVAEVALACLLLVGAGLLFRSFQSVLQISLGFQPESATVWRINPPRSFRSGQEVETYFGGATQRIAAIAGVKAVGITDSLPLRRGRSWNVGAKDVVYAPGTTPDVFPHIVDRQYLQTMQIPLRDGRFFEERDGPQSEVVAVINESMARTLWPDREAVGQLIRNNRDIRVVGVVADVRHGLIEEAASNEMYLLYNQTGDWSGLELVVRSPLPTAVVVREVRAALASYDPALATGEFYELGSLVDNAVAPRRLTAQLLGFLSALALALASIGLYGVIAYSVVQRTQEIGIRMAVGAQHRDVLRLIAGEGLRLAGIGVTIGLVGAFFVTRVLQSQLHGITATDPLTYVAIAAVLTVIALLACWWPARRATKIDPMVALRAE